MDYVEWQPRTEQLLDEAFSHYRDGSNCDLHYFIDDKVNGMSHGKFLCRGRKTKGIPSCVSFSGKHCQTG